MKEIKAIVQPNRIEKIRSALRHLPQFPGMTVIKVQGCTGNEKFKPKVNDPFDELNDFTQKVMLITIAEETMVDLIVQTIVDAASTGQQGDGLIWVTDASHVIRIDRKQLLTTAPIVLSE